MKEVTIKHWSTSLSVMLENVPGLILGDILHATLLIKADFNFGNTFLFGHHLIDTSEHTQNFLINNFRLKINICSIEVAVSRLLYFDLV